MKTNGVSMMTRRISKEFIGQPCSDAFDELGVQQSKYKHVSSSWHNTSLAVRRSLRDEAAQHAHDKMIALKAERCEITTRLKLHAAREQQFLAEFGKPMCLLSADRWTAEDIRQLQSLYDDRELMTTADVNRGRAQQNKPAEAPDREQQLLLVAFRVKCDVVVHMKFTDREIVYFVILALQIQNTINRLIL